ncbi:MAG: O-antigen ligase family protein [Acidobacteria bacterium]|nr:O-antigen ligase family protein [Acidobacteriota bacterium]
MKIATNIKNELKTALDFKDSVFPLALRISLLGVFFMPISTSLMQLFLILGGLIWLVQSITKKIKIKIPPGFLALVIFAGLSIVSIFFSLDPIASLKLLKKISLVLLPVFFYNILDKEKYVHRFLVTLYIGALVNAIYGSFAYQLGTQHRLSGFMGHYMTTAGILMLLIIVLLAEMLIRGIADFGFRKTLILLIFGQALLFTLTRNAWVGAFLGLVILVSLIRPTYVPLGAVVLLLLFLILPGTVKQRIASTFDLQDTTIQDRIKMINTGSNIIKEHPLWGVGAEMVPRVYNEYKASKEDTPRPHLHNNFYQIAAERGLFVLSAWILFLGTIIYKAWHIYQHFKKTGRYYPTYLSISTIVLCLSFTVAGLFEYNWGDTEVAVVFLFLVTLPFIFKEHDRKRGY